MGAAPVSGLGRARRARLMAEINVTPFVDVMLVLLVIFMIAAPLLVAGVPVDLPETRAEAFPEEGDALSVTVAADGSVYLQDEPIAVDYVTDKLEAIAASGYDRRIFVRADGGVAYATVLDVMARIRQAGFENIGLVAEPLEQDAG